MTSEPDTQIPVHIAEEALEASVRPRAGRLTPLELAFAQQFVLNGGKIEEAAIDAGYGGGAKNMGTRNLCKPRVQAYIAELVKRQSGSALAMAYQALGKIVTQGKDERAVVAAAVALMDRFGMAVPKGPLVAIQNNVVSGSEAQAIIAEVHAARQKRLTAPAVIDVIDQ